MVYRTKKEVGCYHLSFRGNYIRSCYADEQKENNGAHSCHSPLFGGEALALQVVDNLFHSRYLLHDQNVVAISLSPGHTQEYAFFSLDNTSGLSILGVKCQ